MEKMRLAITELGSTGLEAWFDVELMQNDVNALAQLGGRKSVVA